MKKLFSLFLASCLVFSSLPAEALLKAVASGSGGTIGGQVSGGTANQILYINSSGNLAGSANLTFNGTTLTAAGLTVTGAISASPANANITLSPTGTGTVTINPATAGTMDNVNIGNTTTGTAKFSANGLTVGTTQLTVASGNVGIGIASANNLLQINSPATPGISQFRITSNAASSFSALVYGADNVNLGFDTDYTGALWIARSTSAFRIQKGAGTVIFNGDTGLTIGNSFTPTARITLDLSTGNLGIGMTPVRALDVTGTFGATGAATLGSTLAVTGATTLSSSVSTAAPNTQTGATYTVAATDFQVVLNNAAGVTVTLPAASSFSGRFLLLRTIAAGAVVSASSNVVPLAGGVAGTAILSATAGKFAWLQSDGTNWEISEAN